MSTRTGRLLLDVLDGLDPEDVEAIRRRLGVEGQRRGWLTSREAAVYLGLPGPGRIHQLVGAGRLNARRAGRSLRFSIEDLDAFLGE